MASDYSITIKCITQGVYATPQAIKDKYKEVLKKANGISCGYDFEIDSIGRWHLHGYFKAKKGLYLKNLQHKGWNIYITNLSDIEQVRKWVSYMHKQDTILLDPYPFQSTTMGSIEHSDDVI